MRSDFYCRLYNVTNNKICLISRFLKYVFRQDVCSIKYPNLVIKMVNTSINVIIENSCKDVNKRKKVMKHLDIDA